MLLEYAYTVCQFSISNTVFQTKESSLLEYVDQNVPSDRLCLKNGLRDVPIF